MTAVGMRVVAAAAEHATGLSQLFARAESPCHCRYWHFEGDKNAWLDRCANDVASNRREMIDALGSDEMRGLVAIDEDAEQLVGWMKLTSAASVQKLYTQRIYRGLPCFAADRSAVFTIGCFLVDEAWRRRGVARELLAAGIVRARADGARAIEAFPRRSDTARAEERWTGPVELFEQAGFVEVHAFAPYPVFRLTL